MSRRQRGSGTIRQLKSGWQVRYVDESGQQVAAPFLFKAKAEANLWMADRMAQVARGTWIDPRRGEVTVGEFGTQWIRDKRYTSASRDGAERNWRNHIEPTFGTAPIASVTTAMVRAWYAERDNAIGPGALRNAHNLLKAVLATAVTDRLIAENPVQIKGANRPVGEERPLMTYDHAVAIADQIAPHHRAMVLTTWWTSARLGEVLALRWKDVDFEARQVHIRLQVMRHGLAETVPKAQSKRLVPLNDTAVEILRQQRIAVPGVLAARVFVNKDGLPLTHHAVNQAWSHAREKAGLPQFRFHDLRHGSATLATQKGATTREVMDRLGHKTFRAALIYQHSSASRGREIAEAMEPSANGSTARGALDGRA